MDREAFYAKKKEIEEERKNKNSNQPKALSYTGCQGFQESPFLLELSLREESVRNGRMTTIIFIRAHTGKREVSGYIDLADRLKKEDFKAYFERSKTLLPKPTDLSYFNWDTQSSSFINNSQNFRVDADSDVGILFRNKRDRKVINVDPRKPPGDGTTRTELETDGEYIQVVFFDHVTRRKH